jgi:hypothetical protein
MHSVILPRPSKYSIADSSISSTRTVDDTARQSVVPPSSPSKSVSFNLEANQEHEIKQLHKDQVYSFYYDKRDYKRFRRQRYEAAQEIKVQGSCYEQVTIRAYEACCKAKRDSCIVLSRGERLLLMLQCRDGKVLGIATHTFEPITQKRESLRRHLLDVVLAIQDDEDCDCELIRAHSERSSLPARLFARELGLAVASGIYYSH